MDVKFDRIHLVSSFMPYTQTYPFIVTIWSGLSKVKRNESFQPPKDGVKNIFSEDFYRSTSRIKTFQRTKIFEDFFENIFEIQCVRILLYP